MQLFVAQLHQTTSLPASHNTFRFLFSLSNWLVVYNRFFSYTNSLYKLTAPNISLKSYKTGGSARLSWYVDTFRRSTAESHAYIHIYNWFWRMCNVVYVGVFVSVWLPLMCHVLCLKCIFNYVLCDEFYFKNIQIMCVFHLFFFFVCFRLALICVFTALIRIVWTIIYLCVDAWCNSSDPIL